MNLKDPNYNMTCFPLFVDVIYNNHKCAKASLGHPQIKSGNHHGCFSKGKKHMKHMKHIPFHGLAYHHLNEFGGEVPSIKKHNPIACLEDKLFQSDVFKKTQWIIALHYVEYKLLKELFLNKVYFFVWGSTTEKIKDGN
jgi:hypothetical protein